MFMDDEEVQKAERDGFQCPTCKEQAHGPGTATAAALLQREGAQREGAQPAIAG